MQELVEPFDEIKFAALSKAKSINHLIKNVTIGPNRTLIEDEQQPSSIANMPKTPIKSSKQVLSCAQNSNSCNLITNQLLIELGKQRQKKVREAISKHVNYFKQFSEQQELEMKQQKLMQQNLFQKQIQQQELMIANVLEQHDKDILAQQQQLVQYHKELAERKRRNDLELQATERRKQQINLIFDRLKADQIDFRNIYQDISNIIKSCKYLIQLKASLGDIIKQLKAIPEIMDEVITQCKRGFISEASCQKTGKLVQEIKGLLEVVKQKVGEVNEVEEEKEKRLQISVTLTSRSAESVAEPVNISIDTSIPTLSTLPPSDIFRFISKMSLKIYSELQSFLQSTEASLTELLNDPSLKQFRFECKKAVNLPVNAISSASTHHLTDKYNRLSNLLNGKTVEAAGTYVSAAKHPHGAMYCKNLLAHSFIQQGDLMISGKPEAAFSYSVIIVALWNEHADFGKLVLAHFHSLCPYLVPMYPPRAVGQTDEGFYQSQGYRYIEGVVEKQDKFLKRMVGIMRLYAAIIITQPRSRRVKHPLSLNEGWRWLSAFVNLEPQPDITATMLHIFLETTGSALEAAYEKSFKKLMVFILYGYLPRIQNIDSGGPVTRLQVFMEKYIKEGRFVAPSGVLLDNTFW